LVGHYLMLYCCAADRIDILRILPGARDSKAILAAAGRFASPESD
jgi:hypothetical protein